MSEAPFYSRRLTSQELDIWLKLGKQVGTETDDNNLAQAFLDLEDSMFFISYLGEDIIGGSSIYKDTARNAMALLSVRITESHRARVSTHIVKSSLPFFRSVAIRQVDAILSNSNNEGSHPFPIQTELQSWIEKPLEENGFEHSEQIQYSTFVVPEEQIDSAFVWDSVPTTNEEIRKLYWSIDDETRPDYSNLWLGMNLSRATNTLHTQIIDADCRVAVPTYVVNDEMVIPGLLIDKPRESSEVIVAVLKLCQNDKLRTISIYTVDEKNQKLLDDFIDICGKPTKQRNLSLLRKFL
ncbi:MAG: hypothetical protein ACFFF4_06130 [Candidatus Thorarchaeota archaeon]